MKLKPIEEFTWFNHDVLGKKTYVFMFNGSREGLIDLLRSRGPVQGSIDIAEGLAHCHPNDQYEKAIGRKVSQFNAKLTRADIISTHYYIDEETYLLQTALYNKIIKVTYYKNSGKLVVR